MNLEKAHSYFMRQLLDLTDYFGEEKYSDEIAAVRVALHLIEKERKYLENMKGPKPILCEFCGKPVSEEMHMLYGAHCSWTCLSRHRKKTAAEKEQKRTEKEREYQRKMSERKRQLYHGEARPRAKSCKPVLQYSKDGKLLNRYEAVRDAALAIAGTPANISSACNGVLHTYKGFVWKYEEKRSET